ncbi:MAG: ATP-binding protein, partial [Nodosilinea sp.]
MGERDIQIQESAVGSAIVSGDGNTIYVIHQTTQQQPEPAADTPVKLGPNPYKGLAAFTEQDGDRYFGREAQVERLWERFQRLMEQSDVPRLLPILGPSGSGKSSLARAGLIPALAQRPLLGKAQMRVAVLVPGSHPLEALAGVLAKAATQDPLPVTKTREFATELELVNKDGVYDGLRRIASLIPQIHDAPLVVLVDQFEEVYSLCKDTEERQAFIANLLTAAQDPSAQVSVVITLRSDFLGETQRHSGLNQIIGSDQSVIVPAMTTEELRRAIAEPAKRAGHPLDEATIDLLVTDTEGREGALPLLQFALSRIWEGLGQGVAPAETYRQMGGVGGALAGKAQDIYDHLSPAEQETARRIFIGLVQLGEGTRDTRRRTPVENLIASQDSPETVKQVLARFSSPGARLVTLASQGNQDVAEVTHEALFGHW